MRSRRLLPVVAAFAAVAAAVLLALRPGGDGAREASPARARDPSPSPPPAAPAPGAVLGAPKPEAPPEAASGSVTAVVTAGGRPLAGARVRAWDEDGTWEATTDARGVARFGSLPPGDLVVRAGADRFAGSEAEVEVEASRAHVVELDLDPAVPFDGRVLDARTNGGIAGARVTVEARGVVGGFGSHSTRPPYDRTWTSEDGAFHVEGVPDGEVATVVVEAAGYRRGEASIRVLGGKPTPAPVEVRLASGVRVVGTVRDPGGRPVEGATVYVMPAGDEQLRRNPTISYWSSDGAGGASLRARTDAKGEFAVEGLADGTEYVAVADAEGFARSAEVTGLFPSVRDGDARAEIALRAPVEVVVRLVDLEGSPVLDAAAVQLDDPVGGKRKTAPDRENEYRFAGVAPGVHRLHVTTATFRDALWRFEVGAANPTDVVVTLDPGARVEGVVVDGEGAPVAGAEVTVGPVDDQNRSPPGYFLVGGRSAKTGGDGRFVVGGLAPVPSYVIAERRSPDEGTPWVRMLERPEVRPPAAGLRLVATRLGAFAVRLLTPEGAPYEGHAQVAQYREGRFLGASGTAVEGGRVRLSGLEAGEYRVEVQPETYAPLSRTGRVILGRTTDLGDARLEPGVTLRVRVVDAGGVPVAGARVSPSSLWGDRTSATDASGEASIPHVAAGTVSLSFAAEGFLAMDQDVVVAAEATPTTVRLARGALVRLRVLDGEGRARPRREVVRAIRLSGPPGPWEEEDYGPSDAEGLRKTRLAPGRWRFALERSEGEDDVVVAEVDLAEGEEKDVDLVLPKR